MALEFTTTPLIGKEYYGFETVLPQSEFPRKVARVVIRREECMDNPRVWMSPMWHFISLTNRDWAFDPSNNHDDDVSSRTEAIDKICQHFGVTFGWDGDELEDDSLLKLIRNAKRKGLIVGMDRNYYDSTLSSHKNMLDNHAYAYISFDEIRHEYAEGTEDEARKKALEYLKGEIDLYNSWVEGDVWYFTAYDPSGEIVDSSGGYYGEAENDFEYIKECAGVTESTIVEIDEY